MFIIKMVQVKNIMKNKEAKRLLKTQDCRVILDPDFGFEYKSYTTRHDDFIDDVIFINELHNYQDYKNIIAIEVDGNMTSVRW